MWKRSLSAIGWWKWMLFAILAGGIALTVARYTEGLGGVTNLSDTYPWGIWKAFNVVAGVGLGGAGFTIMGTVYVFNAERFRPIVRPAILLAFLAYTSVAVALVIDIGKSWAIWHPIVMWNPTSILFDVAWCLMLYTSVLLLEGSGMLFERMGWKRLLKIQHAVTLPIVIVGILLSTLHQSSLGALFLIVPGKLHAFWYTELIPLLFLLSAIGAGLAMVIVLGRLATSRMGERVPTPVLLDLGQILFAVLGVYGVVRLYDLGARGMLGEAFGLSYEAVMLQVELLLGVALPFAVLAVPHLRTNIRWVYAASLVAVAGFVTNRLNVAITGLESAQGGHYVPAWSEMLISLMVVAAAFAAFRVGAGLLGVFPQRPSHVSDRGALPAV